MKPACEVIELPFKTFLRWKSCTKIDQRTTVKHLSHRKLSNQEENDFYNTANNPRFRDLTPGQIVAILLEEGTYYGSERTLYRILAKRKALGRRTESKPPTKSNVPPELKATGPNQVWTWDITWLRTEVKGIFLFAYVILDVYSRKIVGWSIETEESPDLARKLFERISQEKGVLPEYVHSDNGTPMRGLSLVAFLVQMKVGLSYSRPRVSDDNPFIEAFFKTLKYTVGYPKFFNGIDHARTWFAEFLNWYNTQHRHSGIQYVTPEQRHTGQDKTIMIARQKTLEAAALAHPERFVKGARTICHIGEVYLNKAS